MTSSEDRTTTETIGRADELRVGDMKMATVGQRRIVVVRTPSGVHALDNACPHQGYGLATGALDGELLTCQWHNWKYDVRNGSCVLGEEDVACHEVAVTDGEIRVTVTEPTTEERQAALWPSLRRGIESDYVGQIARDTVRLLETGASPADITWEALAVGVPKADYGPGHELAMAADCLALAEARDGDDRALPLVQGLSGISEVSRDRPVLEVPKGDSSIDFADSIEREDIEGAMAATVALVSDFEPTAVRHSFIDVVSQHHLGYGHGIIYTQKAFELLDRVGWERAGELLPHLAATIAWSTREDLLPYMRTAIRDIDQVDLDALTSASAARRPQAIDPDVIDTLANSDEAPIGAAVDLVLGGAGIDGLLDALSVAVSERLLRHDLAVELDADETFGWLDITHGLTMAQAVRWAWKLDPSPQAARLALFATWLLFDTGRAERRHGARPMPVIEPEAGAIGERILYKDVDNTLAAVAAADRDHGAAALTEASLSDASGSFIVTAHLIKTTQAAIAEADEIDDDRPLLATARYMAAPRRERFVERNVAESVDFVRTGRPPKR